MTSFAINLSLLFQLLFTRQEKEYVDARKIVIELIDKLASDFILELMVSPSAETSPETIDGFIATTSNKSLLYIWVVPEKRGQQIATRALLSRPGIKYCSTKCQGSCVMHNLLPRHHICFGDPLECQMHPFLVRFQEKLPRVIQLIDGNSQLEQFHLYSCWNACSCKLIEAFTGYIFNEPNRRFVESKNVHVFLQFLENTVFPPPYKFRFEQSLLDTWEGRISLYICQSPWMDEGDKSNRFRSSFTLDACLVRVACVPVELRMLVGSFLAWKEISYNVFRKITINTNFYGVTYLRFRGRGIFFTCRERRLFIAAYMKFCGLKRLECRFRDADRILDELHKLSI